MEEYIQHVKDQFEDLFIDIFHFLVTKVELLTTSPCALNSTAYEFTKSMEAITSCPIVNTDFAKAVTAILSACLQGIESPISTQPVCTAPIYPRFDSLNGYNPKPSLILAENTIDSALDLTLLYLILLLLTSLYQYALRTEKQIL